MDKNRQKILEMLGSGKISAAEAERLLDKLGSREDSHEKETSPAPAEEESKRSPGRGGSGMGSLMGGVESLVERITDLSQAAVAGAQRAARTARERRDQDLSGKASQGASAKADGQDIHCGPQVKVSGRDGGVASAWAVSGTAVSSGQGYVIPGRPGTVGSSVQVSSGSHLNLVSEERKMAAPHQAGRPLSVQTINGKVEVKADPKSGEVRIKATLRAQGRERLKEIEVVPQRQDEGTLRIEVRWPGDGPQEGEGCDLEVRLPDVKDISVETSNGPVLIAGLKGLASLETANGAIQVHDQEGSVKAHTSNGAIELARVLGDAELKTSNGKITAAQVHGAIEARTMNAEIELDLAASGGGPLDAQTANAGIRAVLGPGFSGQVECKALNGKVNVEGSKRAQVVADKGHKATLVVGADEPLSRLKTSNGNIRVRVAE